MMKKFLLILFLLSTFLSASAGLAQADQFDFDRLLKAGQSKPQSKAITSGNIEDEARASHSVDRNWRIEESAAAEARRERSFAASNYGRTRTAICNGDWNTLYDYCQKQCAGLRDDNGGLLFSSSDRDKCVSSCTNAKHYLCSNSTCFGFQLICEAPCERLSGAAERSCKKSCEKVQADCVAQGGR